MILLAALLAGLACGGGSDDEPTLESYFREVDGVFQRADQRLDELTTRLDAVLADNRSDAEQVAAFRQSFSERKLVLDGALAELSDIGPPVEAVDAHLNFIEASAAMSVLSQRVVEDISAVATTAEIDSYFAEKDAELDAATKRRDDACGALQKLADDNAITVDLECGDA